MSMGENIAGPSRLAGDQGFVDGSPFEELVHLWQMRRMNLLQGEILRQKELVRCVEATLVTVEEIMPPRRNNTARVNVNLDDQMAEAMNNMSAFVVAQTTAKSLRDLEKRDL
ncbi:uncharacterized protein [Cicer arietinum]|uniref:uncharacterized protein n=1 Tax=Cicer arietinum TaxID=3827 RepID=UPI003CC6BA6A